MFDPEFYPTPKDVIAKMVSPYIERIGKATILEPSAGSGAILDYLKEGIPSTFTDKRGNVHEISVSPDMKKVYAIEHSPELQMILTQKGYRLVAEDFLSYYPDTRFDLALMNPPFRTGDQHLLHAWEILDRGDIACLLNAETVDNPYSSTRKLLQKIITQNGTVEHLGPCFHDAENPTDVEVVLVRLHKEPKESSFTLDLDGFAREAMPDFGELASSGDAVMQSNKLDAFIRAWQMAKAAAVNYLKAKEMFELYMNAFLLPGPYNEPVIKVLDVHQAETKNDYKNDLTGHIIDGYNFFVETSKEQAWSTIFHQIGLGKYMTTGLRKELQRFQSEQSTFSLTKENIMKLFTYIMSNIGEIMDNAVVEVYDMFTRFYSGNTSHTEGWKTNKQFLANRKIIIPNSVSAGFMPQKYGYDKYYKLEYGSRTSLGDIDKAMCWLSGRNYDNLTGKLTVPGQGTIPSPKDRTIEDTITSIQVGDQGWHESAFFLVKAFKKGTVHMEFKDESLWAKFNLTVNKGKNALGYKESK